MTNNKIDILENIELFSLDDLEKTQEDFSDEENKFFEIAKDIEIEKFSISGLNDSIVTETVENIKIEEEKEIEEVLKTIIEEEVNLEEIDDLQIIIEEEISIEENKEAIIEEEIQKIKSEIPENIHEKIIEKKNKSPILNNIIFFFKYITTSALIFVVLLATTNYSAYTNIARSYLFKEEMQRTELSIINSVEAAKITTKIKEKEEIIKKVEKEEINKKNTYSMRKLTSGLNKSNYKLDIEITPFENRLIIPKIWKNIPLLDIKNQEISWPKELENIFMKELENGIIRYPGSTKPWTEWNTFVFWHSSNFPWIKWDFNDVFSLLDNLSYWDDIIMYYDQKKYIYRIKEKKVITPWDVEILKRDNKKDELTLMTCWPIWTTLNRLVVIWEIIEVEEEIEKNNK